MDERRIHELKKLEAAIDKFLSCAEKRAPVPRSVVRALAPWLRTEQRKLVKYIDRHGEWVMDWVAWNTVNYYRDEKHCNWDLSVTLAARALNMGEGTIERHFADFKKRFHLPRGNRRQPASIEQDEKDGFVETEDFLPPKDELDELLAKHKEKLGSKRA